jgi:hypothetical protein
MVAGVHSGIARRLEEALDDQGFPKGRGRGAHLAKVGKVSGEAGRKWLAGQSLPTMENALLLSTHLEVCVEWLLTGRGPKKIPSPHTVRVIEAMESLPPDSQVTLQKVANSLVKSAPWDGEVERRRGGKA